MANTSSAKKNVRKMARKTAVNKARRSAVRTNLRRVRPVRQGRFFYVWPPWKPSPQFCARGNNARGGQTPDRARPEKNSRWKIQDHPVTHPVTHPVLANRSGQNERSWPPPSETNRRAIPHGVAPIYNQKFEARKMHIPHLQANSERGQSQEKIQKKNMVFFARKTVSIQWVF